MGMHDEHLHGFHFSQNIIQSIKINKNEISEVCCMYGVRGQVHIEF